MATPDYVLVTTTEVLGDVLPLYRRTPGSVGDAAAFARWRRVLDRLLADTRAAARSTTLAADLAAIASGYRLASSDMLAVIDGLERVVERVRLFQPVEARSAFRAMQREHELALTGLLEALALAETANAVAVLALASQQQAQRLRLRLARTFDVAIERAADRSDAEVLRSLRETQASLVRDLIERGRPLARVVGYETGLPMPAVVLAHMLYQDAGRAGELAAQNPADHPGFMPMTGRAMSR